MPSLIVRDAVLGVGAVPIIASITTWSRLEVLPTSADLTPGLQAQVADPLWFLTRQWQCNELQGEDAGTPVEVHLSGEQARLVRYLPGPLGNDAAERAVDYQHLTLPLEVAVEREAVRATSPRLAAEAGLHFCRLLAAEGVGHLCGDYVRQYPLALDETAEIDRAADPKGAAWQKLLKGRSLDGRKLASDLKPLADADDQLGALPAEPALQDQDTEAVKRAASRWLRWYDASVSEPAGANPSWLPQRLEYALALSARLSDGPVVLTADEYTDGRLDWYSFRASDGPSLGDPAEPVGAEPVTFRPMLPSPIRYGGMPADRFWEFEDSRVNLGSLDAGPTDLGRILMVEFALVYGNDWFIVPVDLPVGSLFRVQEFSVRDTFGVSTAIKPSRNDDGTRWTMYSLTAPPGAPAYLSDLFFLPPVLPARLEGDPAEEVALFRDEMANLVWAVERKVPGPSGEPVDRRLEASRHPLQQRLEGPDIAAPVIYRLATPVPENWIPFVPVPASGATPANFHIQLERRIMKRTVLENQPDGAVVPKVIDVVPRGILLRSDLSLGAVDEPPLRIEEEEVPRDGILVERNCQFSRWIDGQRYLWVGRSKRVGKGEGSSGLRFDLPEIR